MLQERQHCLGFRQAAAERVGHDDISGACRPHQPGDAQRQIEAQFQRIASSASMRRRIRSTGFGPSHRLQENAIVADREIAALNERVAEIAGEMRVRE